MDLLKETVGADGKLHHLHEVGYAVRLHTHGKNHQINRQRHFLSKGQGIFHLDAECSPGGAVVLINERRFGRFKAEKEHMVP
jgi:hypothetical protein